MKKRQALKLRQEQAAERQKVYDSLSIKERISLARSRRGNSSKEINRLEARIEKPERSVHKKRRFYLSRKGK